MPTSSDAQLKVYDALGTRVVDIDRDPFSIGRRESNDLQVAGTEVSRHHADIVQTADGYLIRDHSSYGTSVNGEAVTECELRSGDRIRLGRRGGAELLFLSRDDSGSLLDPTTSPQESLRQVAELLDRLRNLGSERVLHDVLALIIDAALEVSAAERGVVMMPEASGELSVTLARDQSGRTLTEHQLATSRRIPEDVFHTGRAHVVSDLLDDAHAGEHELTRELGIRYVVCLPLAGVRVVDTSAAASGPGRIGVLYLDSRTKGKLLSPGTRAALETLAAEAALAIANASLYRDKLRTMRLEHEMHVAAKLQRELMPQHMARLRHVEAAATCRPCRAVGGDFFDHLTTDGSNFRFTLGDVSGKGPPAALLSAMMLGMFRLASQGTTESPAAIVTAVNQAMCQRGLEARFVTLLSGVIAPDGRMTTSNAGHNPPFVIGKSGVRRLEAGGPIVGVFPAATYEQETITLDPGDVVVVFSDGVTEATNASDREFGEAALLDTIERVGTSDTQVLVEAITDAVQAFSGDAAQTDDITLMAIRYLGPA